MGSKLRASFFLFLMQASFLSPVFGQEDFHQLDEVEQRQRLDRAVSTLRQENFHGALAIKLGNRSADYYAFGRVEDLGFSPELLQVDLLSITKTVTGAAIMKLVDDGKLSVKQPITDFFSGVPSDKAGVTIHQLLTHSAGFRGSIGSDESEIGRDEYVLDALDSRLRFEPGSDYNYSNVGFSLLASIIELLSDKTYEEFIREDLLPPNENLKIGYADVFDSNYSLLTRRGRDISEASWGHEVAYWNLIGNGGMVANMSSALRFFELLTAGALLSVEATETLFTAHQQEFPDQSFYGYGVVIDEGRTYKRFRWHNGGNNRFNSWWSHHLDHDVILFIASTGRFDADEAAQLVLSSLFRDSLLEDSVR